MFEALKARFSHPVDNHPVCERMAGSLGYFPDTMKPPPAEAKPNVLALSYTSGCSHAVCTFCDIYKHDQYRVKTPDEFSSHLDSVVHYYSRHKRQLGIPDRIFIGSGNALSVDTSDLNQAIQISLLKLKKLSGDIPRRVAVYGNTGDILEQGSYGLNHLRCGGMCGYCSKNWLGDRRGLEVVYWGLESGNGDVLKIAGKGYNQYDALIASDILGNAKIRASVMVMPGLGGLAYSDQHVKDTAQILNYASPEWVTFMGLKILPGTPYAKWIENEEAKGTNRRLTPAEITEQTARMLDLMDFPTSIGIHGAGVHNADYNPVSIGKVKVEGNFESQLLAGQLRAQISQLPKV